MRRPDLIFLLYMAGNALTDLRTGTISLRFAGAFAAAGIILSAAEARSPLDVLVSLVPGVVLILLSRASRGGIGSGDGIAVLAAGLFLGPFSLMACLCAGFFMAAAFAGILILKGRRGSSTFPFMPFLFLGSALVFLPALFP